MARKKTSGVLAAGGALVLGGGVAYAADPGAEVFHGCVGKLTGNLRMIDSTKNQHCLA
jgi:hypothetical protein